MKALPANFALFLALAAVASRGEGPPDLATAERLLRRAAEEVRKTGEPPDFEVLLHLGQGLARFDRALASKLLADACKLAQASRGTRGRSSRLERVALHAGLVDGELAAKALDLARLAIREVGTGTPFARLKLLAINLAIADINGHKTLAEERLNEARRFCQANPHVRKNDVETSSITALAAYLRWLAPQVARQLWKDAKGLGIWDIQLEAALSLVHYRSPHATPWVQELCTNATRDPERVAAAAALYEAGEPQQAMALLRQVKPTDFALGQPFSDLVERVAASDPEQAMRLAAIASPGVSRGSALDSVVRGTAAGRPEAIAGLLPRLEAAQRGDEALRLAAASFASRGDLASARRLADPIARESERGWAFASIAEAAKDAALMADALRLAWKGDEYGNYVASVTEAAIRSFGISRTEALLEQTHPQIRGNWRSHAICRILVPMADFDPAWALEVFRRGPYLPGRKDEGIGHPWIPRLLPNLARVDPDLVARYFEEGRLGPPSQQLDAVKREVVLRAAAASADNGERLTRRLRYIVDRSDLERAYRRARIATAGKQINTVLTELGLEGPAERSEAVLEAIYDATDKERCDLQAIQELADTLDDRALADQALAIAVRNRYSRAPKRQVVALANRIASPWRRAGALCSIAHRELYPRPIDREPFLAAWPLGE